MRRPLIALACLLGGMGSLSADELKIEGSNLSRDIPCNNQDIGIYGAENKITLTGICGDVKVHGSKHHVTFEKVDDLEVSGAENTVLGGEANDIEVEVAKNTVKATLVKSNDDDERNRADVDVSGANHTLDLTLKTRTEFEITGAEHTINWSADAGVPEPTIQMMGISNTVTKK